MEGGVLNNFCVGQVIDNYDPQEGGRIKVQLLPADKYKKNSNIAYAFPLMPKLIHIIPKAGEYVFVITELAGKENSQRLYIGPIISQPQFHYKGGSVDSLSMLAGSAKSPDAAPKSNEQTHGAFAETEDIAIYGRKNSDIILSDNDIRIRCGVHLTDESSKTNIMFNKDAPAYIKLKYYPSKLTDEKKNVGFIDKILSQATETEPVNVESVAAVVADKIVLISPNGDTYFDTSDKKEGISDETMVNIIKKAHQLPYGDILVDFLADLVNMFMSHSHTYHETPPTPGTPAMVQFERKYGMLPSEYKKKLLSDSVLIN